MFVIKALVRFQQQFWPLNNVSGSDEVEYVTWWTLQALLSWYPVIWRSDTCKLNLAVTWLNSLAPGRYGNNFDRAIFKLTSLIWLFSNSYEIALWRMPFDPTGNKSTLVQVMAWCRQATSHYLSQCWHRSLSPYGVTRPHWVKDKVLG